MTVAARRGGMSETRPRALEKRFKRGRSRTAHTGRSMFTDRVGRRGVGPGSWRREGSELLRMRNSARVSWGLSRLL